MTSDPAVSWLLPLAGSLAVLVFVRAAVGALRRRGVPRVVARPLLTGVELRFLHVLTEAMPGHFIASQVSMGALLRPEAGIKGRDWWAIYGRFSQKIVDYALIDRGTGGVIALIELDDRSHVVARDAARDAMLQRAGYTVVRFGNRPWPTVESIRQRLVELGILFDHSCRPNRIRTVS